jgi:Holliday junction resolvasome RuvABC endonuclease subunit
MSECVLGLDPNTRRLGWALADLETGSPVACGSEDVTGLGLWVRQALGLLDYRTGRGDGQYYKPITLIYVEGTFGGGRNARAGAMVAEACGQVIQACSRRWPPVPIERLAPTEWKHLIGLKGNATSDDYTLRVTELGWDVPVLGRTTLRYDVDAAAAAGIASAAVVRNDDILERAAAGETL